MKLKSLYIIILLFSASFKVEKNIDNEIIKIGNQFWKKENFDKIKFNNGDIIHYAKNAKEWEICGYKKNPAWCYYKFDSLNSKLGKFYNWYVISDKRGIEPLGWRIPNYTDVIELDSFLYKNYINRDSILNSYNLISSSVNTKGEFGPFISTFGFWFKDSLICKSKVYIYDTLSISIENGQIYFCLPENGFNIRFIKN